MARRTTAPSRTTAPGSSTESTTWASASITTPGDSTDPATDPATRAPPHTRLFSTSAPRASHAAASLPARVCTGHCGSSSRSGGVSSINSWWACQYACTVPTSRQ